MLEEKKIDDHSILPSYSELFPDRVNDNIIVNHVCEKHPNTELEYYCVDCKQLICLRCAIIPPHDQHKRLDFTQAVQYLKPNFQEILNLDHDPFFCSKKLLLVSTSQIISQLQKQKEVIQEQINNKYQQITFKILQRKEELEGDLNQIIDKRLYEVEHQYQKDVPTDLANIHELLMSCQKKDIQDEKGFIELFSLCDKINHILKTMKEKKSSLPPPNMEYVNLNWDISTIETQILCSGQIITNEKVKDNNKEYSFQFDIQSYGTLNQYYPQFYSILKENFLSDEKVIAVIETERSQIIYYHSTLRLPRFRYFITNYARFFPYDINPQNYDTRISHQPFSPPKTTMLLPKYQFLLHTTLHGTNVILDNTENNFTRIQKIIDVHYHEMEKEIKGFSIWFE